MPAQQPKPSKKLRQLNALLDQAEREFKIEHPEINTFLDQQSVPFLSWKHRSLPESAGAASPSPAALDAQIAQDVRQASPSETRKLAENISAEERAAVLDKLRATLLLTPGQIEASSLLYLEQQLTELLGFTVSGSLENHSLTFHTGIIESLPHLRRFPTDSLPMHQRYVEAGLAHHRGIYGWFMSDSSLSAQDELRERYFVSLPISTIPEWQTQTQVTSQWFKYRKVIVINPFDARAVVACVADNKATSHLQYQFGGSPELIREGLFWSPTALGKVCVMFVDDQLDLIPLGPINLQGGA